MLLVNEWRLIDYGRHIHYLRISLTDHCNLRCLYCMPDDASFRPNAELMQDDEVLRFVRLFTRLGFDKYRLTGGEPTVRAGVVELVREIAHTEGVRTLSMTTNGVLFSRLAEPLAEGRLAAGELQPGHPGPGEIRPTDPPRRPERSVGWHPGG